MVDRPGSRLDIICRCCDVGWPCHTPLLLADRATVIKPAGLNRAASCTEILDYHPSCESRPKPWYLFCMRSLFAGGLSKRIEEAIEAKAPPADCRTYRHLRTLCLDLARERSAWKDPRRRIEQGRRERAWY